MTIFTYKNLYRAYLDCRKTKRKTVNALKFELNLEENLMKLLDELKNKIYRPGRSICFVVTTPCAREIFAADFQDRIIHHLFVRELISQAEQMFIYDSFACRKHKGTHKAVKRVHDFSKRITINFRRNAWYMKVDIASFFMSIDQNILYNLVLELIDRHKRSHAWKLSMSDLAGIIIFHNPIENYLRKGDSRLAKLIPSHKSLFGIRPGRGLPIGNYSSQFFANLYMNKLDHFIKRDLKCRFYIRYVDDLLLMSCGVKQLKYFRDKINKFLNKELSIKLNSNKTIIQPLERGIDFLGYFLKVNKIFAKRKVYKRYKNKLFQAATGLNELSWNKSLAISASYQGYAGYF